MMKIFKNLCIPLGLFLSLASCEKEALVDIVDNGKVMKFQFYIPTSQINNYQKDRLDQLLTNIQVSVGDANGKVIFNKVFEVVFPVPRLASVVYKSKTVYSIDFGSIPLDKRNLMLQKLSNSSGEITFDVKAKSSTGYVSKTWQQYGTSNCFVATKVEYQELWRYKNNCVIEIILD